MVARASNPSSWQVALEGSGVQDHPRPHSKFKAILDYKIPCLKNSQNKRYREDMLPVPLLPLWLYSLNRLI